jgi:hypothetical protein
MGPLSPRRPYSETDGWAGLWDPPPQILVELQGHLSPPKDLS